MSATPTPADASLRRQPLSAGLRLAYSFGAAPDAMINTALNVFLLYYLTSICGLSPALAGFAVAAGLVIDALLDPWIGMQSDHCRSRLGRRLPFMLGAAPVLVAAFVLLFSLPRIENQSLLFGIVMLLCISIRIGLSTFALPYLAVGAEISDDSIERARIITWRWTTAVLLSLATVVLGFGLFFKGENGIAREAAYPAFFTKENVTAQVNGYIASVTFDTTVFPGADFNFDGGVDGSDVEAFFIAWQEGAVEADFNIDGGVDGQDVEAFFIAWENG